MLPSPYQPVYNPVLPDACCRVPCSGMPIWIPSPGPGETFNDKAILNWTSGPSGISSDSLSSGYFGSGQYTTGNFWQIPIPYSFGKARNLTVALWNNVAGTPYVLAIGQSVKITLYKNGVATSLSVTIPVGKSSATDSIDRVSVVRGDLLAVKVESFSGIPLGVVVGLTASVEIDG